MKHYIFQKYNRLQGVLGVCCFWPKTNSITWAQQKTTVECTPWKEGSYSFSGNVSQSCLNWPICHRPVQAALRDIFWKLEASLWSGLRISLLFIAMNLRSTDFDIRVVQGWYSDVCTVTSSRIWKVNSIPNHASLRTVYSKTTHFKDPLYFYASWF